MASSSEFDPDLERQINGIGYDCIDPERMEALERGFKRGGRLIVQA